jgi:hypothetical protein
MTENSAIFDTRHGAGSSHPHRRRAPWGADLPETRERGKLTSNPEAIWGMSAQLNPNPIVARLNVETYLHELMLRPAG